MKKVLILFSGGADSRLLISLAKVMKLEIHCLMVDYGQRHIAELVTAQEQCDKLGLTWTCIKLKLPVNSALTGDLRESQYKGVSEWYVPSRNLIFLGLAACVAEDQGIDLIWYGADFSDRLNLFPDCYQEWVIVTNKLLEINGSKPLKLEAPLLGFTKDTTNALLKHFNVKEEEVFSGYGIHKTG